MAKLNKEKTIRSVKAVAKTVGGVCIEVASCGVIRTILPKGVGAVIQAGALAGGLLIGGMLNDRLDGYVEKTVDGAVKELDDTVSEVKRCLDVIQDKDLEEKTD